MTEINFQPVFEYIDKSSENLKTEILLLVRDEIRGDLRRIETNIANIAGQVQGLLEEMRISNYRVTRLENWALPVGKKVGLPLDL